MLRCQPRFWCIPPALASGWPRTPAPTAETFQCFSGAVFTLQQTALLSLSASSQPTVVGLYAQYAYVAQNEHDNRGGESLRDSKEEVLLCRFWTWKLNSHTIIILPDLKKLERDISVSMFQAQPQEGRLANGSSYSDAKILPLSSTVRANVNTMTSLCLPFKWISAVDLQI